MDAAGAAARARARASAESAKRDKGSATAQPVHPVRRNLTRLAIAIPVIALVALAGYGIVSSLTRSGGIAAIFEPGRPTASPTATPAVILPATGFGPTGARTEATVERVVDGDTIVVRSGGVELYVRYLGVDAPEAVRLDSPVQFMAPEATQANAQLVSGQTVILERDVSDTDGFGRLLRHVWVDRGGTVFLVGLELVKAGFARDTPVAPDTKYQALYADAQAQAQAAGLGIWGTPPSAAPDATLPPSGPTPSLEHFVSLDPLSITTVAQPFRGGIGIYEWAAVAFEGRKATLAWDVSSATRVGCDVDWSVQSAGVEAQAGTVTVGAKARKTGAVELTAPTEAARVTVTSTCTDWLLTIREAG